MKKRWITAVLTLSMLGFGSVALGDSVLKIYVNGDKIDSDISASDSKTIQKLAEKLGAFSNLDKSDSQLEIEKPKVNLLVLEGIQQLKNKNILFTNPIQGYRDKNIPRTFNVFVDIDNAPVTDDLKIQLVLIGPNGKEVEDGKVMKFSTKKGTSFYFSYPFISTKLGDYGTYKIQAKMKTDDYEDFVVVGENTITVGK
ncbi:hypothetical protein [Brevibacillus fulvus]|uniref:Copper amine oxidase-like N-terminal domain-containing protein n=1 Tax=Brevibacillus fulvus TaxID=1125967 RepID=A0A938XWM6_9BACL|nr:hypothetical protein [Brevibacillus fulvus]MBM7589271.1 hypothetical protein [Brevibacillus fulvus]